MFLPSYFRSSISLIAIGVIGLVSCKADGEKKIGPPAPGAGPRGGNQPTRVEAFLVKQASVSEKLEVPGSLIPFESTELRPEVSGRITQLNIREGQSVAKGALLVKLYDEDLQAQLKKLKVQLEMNEKNSTAPGRAVKN